MLVFRQVARSSLILIGLFVILECVKCGPDGQGTCFGPNLCCGQTFGCYFNSKETTLCLYTNLTSTRPCDEQFWSLYLKAEMCSLDSNDKSFDGVCVADGLCCSLGTLV